MALAFGSLLTVLLLGVAMPPLELSAAAWVAFVPLLVVLRPRPGRWGWLVLCLAGLAYGVLAFISVRHVTWVGTLLLGVYLSLYFAAFCWSVRWLAFKKGLVLALAAPLAWTALEHIRSVFLTGLPLALVGHTQYKNLSVIQIADLVGAPGVTFWLVAVSGAVGDAVCHFARLTPERRPARVLAGALGVLIISVAAQFYGWYRLDTLVIRKGPPVAVIQGNVPQEVKLRPTLESLGEIVDSHVALTRQAQEAPERPALVIWPETMAPPGIFNADFESLMKRWLDSSASWKDPKERRKQAEEMERYDEWRGQMLGRRGASHLLISTVSYDVRPEEARYRIEQRNSVHYFRRSAGTGAVPAAERYDKIHLVPFGEYVPLRSLIGWLVGPFVPYKEGLRAGTERKLFEVDGWRFAPTICFEDAFPELVADFARGGERMDFIVNVTNEGWFKDGGELDQHLAIGVFRAVECRAGLIRAANTGISAFVSPTGRVLARLTVDGSDRQVSGVLQGYALTAEGRSPYLSVGELFGRLCFAVWILCMLCRAGACIKGWVERRRSVGGG